MRSEQEQNKKNFSSFDASTDAIHSINTSQLRKSYFANLRFFFRVASIFQKKIEALFAAVKSSSVDFSSFIR